MIAIVKKWGVQGTTKLLVTVKKPSDNRSYWSGKRGAEAGVKLASVIVARPGEKPFKTDLWVGPKEQMVLGGLVCRDCHHRQVEGIRCNKCGGPNLVHMHFKVPDDALVKIKSELAGNPGDFPFMALGMKKSVKTGEPRVELDPESLPEEARSVITALWDRGYDPVDINDDTRQQRVIIPLMPDDVRNDPEVRFVRALTTMNQIQNNLAVDVIGL